MKYTWELFKIHVYLNIHEFLGKNSNTQQFKWWHDFSGDQNNCFFGGPKYWTPRIPELRGGSTGSMVTNFVFGITFLNGIWVKWRRSEGPPEFRQEKIHTPTGLRLHFTQIPFENVTQEKVHNLSYSRRSPKSSFSNLTRTLTLILSGGNIRICTQYFI